MDGSTLRIGAAPGPISAINGFEMAAPKQPFPPMPRPLLLSLPDSATISDSELQEEVR
jgi:hypothetical protein